MILVDEIQNGPNDPKQDEDDQEIPARTPAKAVSEAQEDGDGETRDENDELEDGDASTVRETHSWRERRRFRV